MATIQNTLLKIFEYADGFLLWKDNMGSRAKKGSIAGSANGNGYWRVRLNKKLHYAHRLIFAIHYGYIPKYIDHIDNNPLNNKIENLREVTQTQNNCNSKKPKDNTSGTKGVYWFKPKGKWKVQISLNGKAKHFGYFDNIELAELVAIEARDKFHGIFARIA